MRSLIEWWNTPSENLKTNGENLVFLFLVVLPILVLLTLPLLKLTGVVGASWWVMVLPLLLLFLFPVVSAFMVTGRSILMKGTSVKELPVGDPVGDKYLVVAGEEARKNQITDYGSVRIYEDLEDKTTVYVVYELVAKGGQESVFRVELDKKTSAVRSAATVTKGG